MASRSLFALLSLLFVAGALAMMFFIILGGVTNASPVNKFYFLQVDTTGVPGFQGLHRWTFWNLCPVVSGKNKCGNVHPAFPFDPPSHRNFDTDKGVPAAFIGTSKYFYLTRFMFAFELIALFFVVCAFFTGILALCTRLGSYLSGLLASIGLFFQTLTAALMTSAYVLGRDHFRSAGHSAEIGEYAFGLEWAAVTCLLIATILFCLGGKSQKDTTSYNHGRRSFFGGKRSKSTKSTRSRGSFINGTNDKEYAV